MFPVSPAAVGTGVIRSLAALLFLLLLTASGAAGPLMPDHIPAGAYRSLEAGDSFTLLGARLFEEPELNADYFFAPGEREVELLSAVEHFYRLRLAPDSVYYVYRSELGLRDLKNDTPVDGGAARDPALVAPEPAPPQAGDTLSLRNFVCYSKPDLLGGHELLAGTRLCVVLQEENPDGFLKLLLEDGERGFVYRGELDELQRRLKP